MLDHLASLSALELDPQEAPRLLADISAILAYVERIDRVEVSESIDSDMPSTRRCDQINPSSTELLTELRPEAHHNLFSTPVASESLAITETSEDKPS